MDLNFIKSEKYESFTINVQIYDAGNIALVTMLKMTGRVGTNSIMEVKMIWR